ncbi:hypothetical protein D3C76_1466190 [compost metagenome]
MQAAVQLHGAAMQPDVAAAIGHGQPGMAAQQGGFAGSGRAEQGDALAGADVECHLAQHAAVAECLAQRGNLNDGGHGVLLRIIEAGVWASPVTPNCLDY